MTVTLRTTAAAAALVCLAGGLIAGRCWQGQLADRAYEGLLAKYNEHLAADSAAARVDASRTDTVRVIRFRTDTLIASADSVGRLLDSTRSRIRKQMADSTQRVFDAWTRAVVSRDSLRLATIANLTRIAAVQDSQMVAAKASASEANALLAQAMPQLRAALARADRRWHLVLFGGYGISAAAGSLHPGPVVGVGIAYTIF